jgi:hypothetical protein
MKRLNDGSRNFSRHLGIYIIVILTLAIINVLTTRQISWVLGPALVWGAAVAIHLLVVQTEDLTDAMKAFIRHFGAYVIIMGGLATINIRLAFWPALIWGAGVVIHFLTIFLSEEGAETEDALEDLAATNDRADQSHSNQGAHGGVKLASPKLQAQLDQALAYQAQIHHLAETAPKKKTRARLQDIATQVNDWTTAIQDLARRIDNFQQNTLIRQDLETVPEAIANLETQLADETDPAIQAALERTLANRKNQLASLERLQHLMHQAEIQLESTLSSLGTIYSQILTDQSTNQVADYTHLSSEAEEETHLLQDRLEALAEIRLGGE